MREKTWKTMRKGVCERWKKQRWHDTPRMAWSVLGGDGDEIGFPYFCVVGVEWRGKKYIQENVLIYIFFLFNFLFFILKLLSHKLVFYNLVKINFIWSTNSQVCGFHPFGLQIHIFEMLGISFTPKWKLE